MHDLNGAKNGLIEHHIKYNRYHKYNRTGIIMNTIHKMSIYVVLIAILALVPNVSATGYMDGNNWTGIDNILDSYGFSYLKNNSGMSNPATADLDMGNYNITGLGQSESYSYLIYTDGTNYYAKNGSTGNVDYSDTNGSLVFQYALDRGSIFIRKGNFSVSNISVPAGRKVQGSGFETILYNPRWYGSINQTLYLKGNNTVSDIQFKSWQNGTGHITIYYSNHNIIMNNRFDSGGNSIYVNGDYNTIMNNYIEHEVFYGEDDVVQKHGIMTSVGSTHNLIFNNRIIKGQRGIYMINSSYNKIINNRIENVYAYSMNLYGGSSYNLIQGNNIDYAGISGIQIEQTQWPAYGAATGNIITGNYITNTASSAISVSGNVGFVSSTIIRDNYLVSNARGIHLTTKVTDTIIEQNIMIDNQYGGVIDDNTLGYSTIRNNYNSGNGVYANSGLDYSSDNYGTSPFNFGNNATAPTASGAGDTFYNSTSNIQQLYTGSAWDTILTSLRVYAGNNVTVTPNATGIVISSVAGSSYNGTYDAKMSNPATADLDMNTKSITNATIDWTLNNISLQNATVNDTGLVLDMRFNENSTGTATSTKIYDSSKFSNDGTWYGNTTPNWTSSKYGGGLSFDGVNDYVNAGNDASLNITNAITISAWVKFSGTQINRPIVSKWGAAVASSYIIAINSVTAGKITAGVNTTANQLITTSLTYNNNLFHHVVMTYNGSYVNLYIDSKPETPLAVSGSINSTSNNVIIGNYGTLTGATFFNGSIDEVRIYNRALSASEIRTLYYSSPLSDKSSFIHTDNFRVVNNTGNSIFNVSNNGVTYKGVTNYGNSATAPTASSAGDIYFNTTNKQPYFHNGTIFITGYGEGGFTLTNGTNDIAVGTTNTKYWFSSGILTALSLSAVESGNFNLSVNNTATGCLNYITLSSAQNNMTSGLNCVYNAGDRMNFTVISNSGIHQVSVGAKYTKTS